MAVDVAAAVADVVVAAAAAAADALVAIVAAAPVEVVVDVAAAEAVAADVHEICWEKGRGRGGGELD